MSQATQSPELRTSRSGFGQAEQLSYQQANEGLLDALSGLHADGNRSVVQRTRAAVRDAALSSLERRRNRRRNIGIATLAAVMFLVLLSPALWSVADELVRGEYLSDLTPMVTLSVVLLFCGALAALVAGLKSQHPFRHGRRNF